MPDQVLFNPDNRQLGSSTGDLSLYGGQTDPSMAIREARGDDSAEMRSPAAGDDGSLAGANAAAQIGDAAPSAIPVDSAASPGSAGATSFLISSPLSFFQPGTPVPSEGGPVPGVTTWHAEPAPAAPVGAGAPIPDLTPAQSAAPAPAQPIEVADNLAQAALAQTETTVAALGDVAGHVIAAPTALVATALDHLAETPATLIDTVSPILDGTAGTPGAIGDAASDTVSATVNAAADTLDGLAGTDPEGGVATLVSLVSVADMFDLNPVGAPAAEDSADPGLAMLDTLAADDLLPDALLGGNHDDHGGLLDHGADTDHLPGL